MTTEEIIAMAKEAGLMYMPQPNSPLVRIVRKAVAKEREACALVCDGIENGEGETAGLARECAAAIRARGAV